LPFEVVDPEVDETARANEAPADLALRLALTKASAVAERFPEAIVIGGDQVAVLDGRSLGKPTTHARAVEQLRMMRGQRLTFHTAVAVVHQATNRSNTRLIPAHVEFRAYSEEAIESYVRAEQAYDCVGAAKIEGLGIALVRRFEGEDPTALIGLPLIALVEMLAELGCDVLQRT